MAVVTSRYARALADVITDQKLNTASVLAEVRSLQDLAESNIELRRVWENPSIPAAQKRKLLDSIVAKMPVSKPVRNFMAVLIDHHRVHQLEEIVRLFERELNDRMGLQEAEITSARALSEEERRQLEAQISNVTGKRVIAKYSTDPGLLGGAKVRVGSTIYDGSVRGQLQKLKEALGS